MKSNNAACLAFSSSIYLPPNPIPTSHPPLSLPGELKAKTKKPCLQNYSSSSPVLHRQFPTRASNVLLRRTQPAAHPPRVHGLLSRPATQRKLSLNQSINSTSKAAPTNISRVLSRNSCAKVAQTVITCSVSAETTTTSKNAPRRSSRA